MTRISAYFAPLALSQTGLHAVERRRQRDEIVVLHHRQPLQIVASHNTFGSCGEVARGCSDGENEAPTVIGTAKTSHGSPRVGDNHSIERCKSARFDCEQTVFPPFLRCYDETATVRQ